jgi:hypothetical protein
MTDPTMTTNFPSATWLKATADDELRADPMPALVYVQRDAMAGAAVLTPVVEGYEPIACRMCDGDE